MQLPQQFQHFPLPTLIVASDSILARFFLAGGDSLEELDGVSLPRERKQDSEGSFASSDGSRVGGPESDVRDEPRLRKFIQLAAEQTEALVQQHNIATIHPIMPAEIEHLYSGELSPKTRAKLSRPLHLNLLQCSPLEIIARISQT